MFETYGMYFESYGDEFETWGLVFETYGIISRHTVWFLGFGPFGRQYKCIFIPLGESPLF